jgi:hypothetical protein
MESDQNNEIDSFQRVYFGFNLSSTLQREPVSLWFVFV